MTPCSSRRVNDAGTSTRRQIIGLMFRSRTLSCRIGEARGSTFFAAGRRGTRRSGVMLPPSAYTPSKRPATPASHTFACSPRSAVLPAHLPEAVQVGRLFGMSQSKANQWIHVLLPALLAALRGLGDAPPHGSGAQAGCLGGGTR